MGEYREAVLDIFASRAAYRDYFGISSVSPCAMKTYHNWMAFKLYHATGEAEAIPRERYLVMDDGHYQETAIVDTLRRAGYALTYVGDNQCTVKIGKAEISGHPDGFIRRPDGTDNRRMTEFKARNYSSYILFRDEGIEAFPDIKCQVQLYLASPDLPYKGITEAAVYFKHKETALPEDRIEVKDEEFSGPIIESLDSMFIGGNVPEPKKIPMCNGCKYSDTCWEGSFIDFTGFDVKPELQASADKWIQGKSYEALGEKLLEEAIGEIKSAIGETEETYIGPIRVKQSSYPSSRFNKDLFLKDHTEEEYFQYCKTSQVNKLAIKLL